MKQLQGQYTNAVTCTDLVEQEALEQIQFLRGQSVAQGGGGVNP